MEYTLVHIVQEKGKWFADIRNRSINGMLDREYTGDIWGENGMSYNSLQCMLSEYYNIEIPVIKKLKLIKRIGCKNYIQFSRKDLK